MTEWNDKAAIQAIQERIKKRMVLVGEFVRSAAAANAPVDTGNLRSSIIATPVSWDTVRIGTNVEYAIWQEFGTRYMSGRPYLRPAIYENKDQIKRILGDAE